MRIQSFNIFSEGRASISIFKNLMLLTWASWSHYSVHLSALFNELTSLYINFVQKLSDRHHTSRVYFALNFLSVVHRTFWYPQQHGRVVRWLLQSWKPFLQDFEGSLFLLNHPILFLPIQIGSRWQVRMRWRLIWNEDKIWRSRWAVSAL